MTPGRKTLRPYQNRVVGNVFNAWDEGLTRPAIAIATGGGKSVVFGEVATIHLDAYPKPGPVVLLVHRRELVNQAAMHFRNANPHLNVEVVMGSPGKEGTTRRAVHLKRWAEADILCTTVQTLSSANTMRSFPDPSLVIVDEAHRSPAGQYIKVLKALGCFSGTKTLGVTATPFREDFREFSDVWQQVVSAIDIGWLISHNHDADGNEIDVAPGEGYLIPPELHHLIVDGLDLTTVPMSRLGGTVDFREGALAAAMEEAGAFEMVAKTITNQFSERKGIIFAPTVESSKYLAETLTLFGLPCNHVDGTTPTAMRDKLVNEMRSGKVRWMSNVNVFTEGFDLPDIDMVVLAKPTKSRIFFRQAVGRALRPSPGKTNAIVLDVAGASDGQTLAGIEALTDNDLVTRVEGESLTDLLSRTEREKRGRYDRIRAHGDRAKELAERATRASDQVRITAEALSESLPGVLDFVEHMTPAAEKVLVRTTAVSERVATVSPASTMTELDETERFCATETSAASKELSGVDAVKATMRAAIATLKEEPDSVVAQALVTGEVYTVRGNLFGLGAEADKPGAPGEVGEMKTKTRDRNPKPVAEERYGWALRTTDGHLYAPIHAGGKDATAFAVAVKLGEDRYLPVVWDVVSGNTDTISAVTTMDDGYYTIVDHASTETEAMSFLSPQAAWRKKPATKGSKSWGFARRLHPELEIPENATAGYLGDLITVGLYNSKINALGRYVVENH